MVSTPNIYPENEGAYFQALRNRLEYEKNPEKMGYKDEAIRANRPQELQMREQEIEEENEREDDDYKRSGEIGREKEEDRKRDKERRDKKERLRGRAKEEAKQLKEKAMRDALERVERNKALEQTTPPTGASTAQSAVAPAMQGRMKEYRKNRV